MDQAAGLNLVAALVGCATRRIVGVAAPTRQNVPPAACFIDAQRVFECWLQVRCSSACGRASSNLAARGHNPQMVPRQ